MNRYLIYFVRRIKKILSTPVLWVGYFKDYFLFKKLLSKENRGFDMGVKDLYPCLDDKTNKMSFDFHYTYHPAWAARIIAKVKPEFHVDISSVLYFSAIISAFVPVKYYEYRKTNIHLDNLITGEADLLSLPFLDNSIKSISCMHTIEHVGLGRYGDSIDPNGDLKAIKELKRVLATDGSLLLVVPVGKPKIYFNGQRVYSYNQIIDYFSGLTLKEFTLITMDGKMIRDADRNLVDKDDYGCGCFWFMKKI
jgi:SAM-dependent methyltransferase